MRSQNPLAWLGALALALPMLIHLFSRQPARSALFPSLRFLDVSRLLPTRRMRLSDVPLLLVRLAILLFAVAALAQPLFGNRTAPMSSSAVARAFVFDTLTSALDSGARASMVRDVTGQGAASAASLQVLTDAPRVTLAGATEWLAMQPMRRELVVVSNFANGRVDSLSLAALPSDITLRLVRAPTRRSTPVPDSAHHAVVVAAQDADSLALWTKAAGPLATPWMGDAVLALSTDSSLVTASAMTPALRDTGIAPPFVVIARAANGSPMVAAVALSGGASSSRLLLIVRAPQDALVTAAAMAASSRAVSAPERGGDTTAIADARLRAWERAPAATPGRTRSALADDYETGPSDARYVWLLVALLLGVETWMRRRTTVSAERSHE